MTINISKKTLWFMIAFILILVLGVGLFISSILFDNDQKMSIAPEPKIETSFSSINTNQFAEILDNPEKDYQLVDLRTPTEFNQGTIPGSKMIDFYSPEFRSQLDSLDKSEPVAIYCNSGNRSTAALGIMKELGFSNVVELDGGIQAWQQSGLALETPQGCVNC